MNNDINNNNEYEDNPLATENSKILEDKEENGVSLYDRSNYYYSEEENNSSDEGNAYGQAEQINVESGRKTLLWSVLSLIFGITSVVCCCFLGGGIVLAISSIVFSILARKKLGYFDGLAIAGLILGIFGVVFGISAIIFTMLGDFTADIFSDVNNYPDVNSGI